MAGITDIDKDQKGEEDAHGGTESDSAENSVEQCAVNGHVETMEELPTSLSTSASKLGKLDMPRVPVKNEIVTVSKVLENGDGEPAVNANSVSSSRVLENGHEDSDCAENCPHDTSVAGSTELALDVSATTNGVTEGVSPNENADKKSAVHNGEDKCEDTSKDCGDAEESCKTEEEKSKEQEIVLIQDTGFNVQVSCPGLDTFDLPVSSMELVQEIHQVLMDREDTCHRTCFSLQLDGLTLDNFAELKSIEGLKDGSLIKVTEEPYTGREARIHVRHVRDLLKSVDPADAYNGVDCNSLSFLNTVTAGDILEKKRGQQKSVDCTPPEHIMPGSRDRPLIPLHPGLKDQKAPACLKVLTYSGWNPPPGTRRLHGDLLYLYVVTLEDKRFHLTASARGFYVNQSTEDDFNPKPASQKHLSHSLIELLNQLSPLFKRNFSILLKKRAQKHPFERVPTPYQVYSWLAPTLDHNVDFIRAEDAFSTRLGYEEHIPGQTRDWNEELQTTRELSRKTLPERLIRERAIFKVHSDFVAAATRGAIAVIDGNVMAINPGEETKMQMFIWNNIFFSLGFDVRDHYKDFGGDSAAYAAPGNDLQGVRAYFSVDPEELYTLGTVVVDYRGYRVTAQSIIPGILEREQEQSVVYGSVDFGKTVVTHDKYKELLQKTASQLKIRPHKVINDKEEEVELFSSVECKSVKHAATDYHTGQRLKALYGFYILLLYRITIFKIFCWFSDITEWLSETPRSMWKKISDEVKEYFHYNLDIDSVDTLVEKFGIQKISLLRSISIKCGLQILLKEYNLDSRHKQPFNEEDVVNVYPNVKHVHPKATDAYHFFTSGQSKIQQGMFRDGYELISEALNLLNNVYGAMHPEIAACLRLLARLNYIMGDYAEALSFQQRAVMMSERVLGIDHPNTITEYAHLALYCFANNQVSSALRLMYRARYLALLCHGENHPEVALFDSNIGLILHAVEEYELSLRFLDKALELNIRFFGAKSLKAAMSYHLVARTHSCRGDFRAALQSEKEAYTIYKQQLGEEHERTKESSDCLKHLTQQAVVFQKKMNEIEKGERNITLPPLQIQTPSLSSVLDTLNVINGIVLFRSEFRKGEQLSESNTQGQDPSNINNNNNSSSKSPSPGPVKSDSSSQSSASLDSALSNGDAGNTGDTKPEINSEQGR
ncbi:LOW QUALITY PROTEIN: clustered mitochondria protein homolog [Liolophura sinensis]|uniref:LOW QUALITY PROTEIN: clustered mitochondria protein homolog n=1 Tax=Liolophura sinensis TaxID=3198878 RepID=UPI0031596A39